jgi:hypothetical protein
MTNEELSNIVSNVTAALAARQAPVAPPGPTIQPLSAMPGMTPQTTGPIGVAVAITIPLPDGTEASAYLTLDPSALSNLPQTIALLQQQGWPVRVFQPRQNGWGRPSWGQNSYGRRAWR